MAAIVETVDSKNLSLIRSAVTSPEAYAILARKHESKSVANVSTKMRQLINLVQTTDLPTFTQEIEVLREQIAAGIAAIKDASLLDILAITVMLRGAHPDFGAAIAAINQGETMDYDSCRADMDAEAERLRYDGKGLVTKTLPRPQPPRGFGKYGVSPEDKPADPFGEKGEKYAGPPCGHCGKTGHTQQKCFQLHPEILRKPKDKPGTKREEAKAAKAETEPDYAMAWTVTSSPGQTDCDDEFMDELFGPLGSNPESAMGLPSDSTAEAPLLTANMLHTAKSVSRAQPGDNLILRLAVDSCASLHFVPTTQGVTSLDAHDTTPVFCADNHEVRTAGSGTIPTSLDGTPRCVTFLPKSTWPQHSPQGCFQSPKRVTTGRRYCFIRIMG
jgi:hypothetical protein